MSPKQEKPLNKIGIIGRKNLEGKKIYIQKIMKFLEKNKKEVYFDSRIANTIGKRQGHMSKSKMMKEMDMIITLGGDGTLLKAIRETDRTNRPYILGVNLGTLGFLSELHKPERIIETLERVFKGKYHLDDRTLLRVTIYRDHKKFKTFVALNDAVINQGNFARLIQMSVTIDQRKMIRFKADGVIVATPTGSTGHSLSAGGPIIHPQLPALIMTPICPTSLSNRPIVIPNNRQLNIYIETERRYKDNDIGLTMDGQVILPLKYGDEIKIRKSSRTVHLIRISNKLYYKMLRDKMGWGK